MNRPAYGPWSSSLDNGSRLQLNAFWKRRMQALPGLMVDIRPARRTMAITLIAVAIVAATPLIQFMPGIALAEQPPAEAKSAPDADAARFGAPVERTINDNGHGEYMIDFDSGKLFEQPEDREFATAKEVAAWARSQGIDAMGQVKSSYKGLIGFDMIAIPSDGDGWSKRAGGVVESLAGGDLGTPVTMDARAGLPATFFIQTREGGRGVLQIVGYDEDNDKPGPDNVQVRYKLIAARGGVKPRENSGEQSGANRAKDEGSPLLRKLQRAGAPLLRTMAERHGYGLAEGQLVRRVAPPFPDVRMDWYRAAHPTQAGHIPAGPDAMLFRWEKDRLNNWGMSFGGFDLEDVLDAVAQIKPEMIEGSTELRDAPAPGDWIVRPGAPREQVIAQLEQILNKELSLGVRLRFKSVPREVYVARGTYRFTPLPGQPTVDETQLTDRVSRTDPIQVFGAELVPNSGAGGMGDFNEFCQWVGRWVGSPMLSEAEKVPGEISWRLHEASPMTDESRALAHDAELVLANISVQTGLEFAKETRTIEVLFVEQAEPDDAAE